MHFARFSSFLKKIALERGFTTEGGIGGKLHNGYRLAYARILYILYLYIDSVSIDGNLPWMKDSHYDPSPFSRHIWEVIRISYMNTVCSIGFLFSCIHCSLIPHPPPRVYSSVKVNWSDARNGHNEITPAFHRIMARKCDKRLFSGKILRISFSFQINEVRIYLHHKFVLMRVIVR